VLEGLRIGTGDVRTHVVGIVGRGDEPAPGQLPFTPRSKKVFELALRTAVGAGHHSVGTEHILLGLVGVNGGVAERVLLDLGADAERIEHAVYRELGTRPPPPRRPQYRVPVAPALLTAGLAVGILVGWLIWGA
jgi:ATP-dependent Clp protease ATP-binding subunit ClpC